MDKMTFCPPTEHILMLSNLSNIPFAKADNGYQFASWVYDLNYDEDLYNIFLESPRGKEAAEFLKKAKAELENIVITEEDYQTWVLHKKDAGGVARYHKVIHDLTVNILMLAINCTHEEIVKGRHRTEDSFYTNDNRNSSDEEKQILNKNNPFADVTIKSQQFFYKAADGSTETLFFNTNNIVDKVDKNGKNLITMHPGFSVTKEHGVIQKPVQKVTFSNSITESIVNDEEHIYIHID